MNGKVRPILAGAVLGILLLGGAECLAGRGVPEWPEASFAVASDLHVYDPELGVSGAAFEEYLKKDRKMIRESLEITTTALERIGASTVDFVLITGDLTKDGELVSHHRVAGLLRDLEAKGKRVYVVPGNHDVNNPEAQGYRDGKAVSVAGLGTEGFRSVYDEFGFSEAISRDRHSLSYVVEPIKGLRLVALDGVTYPQSLWRGEGSPMSDPYAVGLEERVIPGGAMLRPGTKAWLKGVLADARRQGKAVIAFTHHGLVEHFSGQSLVFSKWLYTDRYEVMRILANGGVRVVFTGHFHSQDITAATPTLLPGFYDVQTGSLATSPCPYRIVNISRNGVMDIDTVTIGSIPSMGSGFRDYAKATLEAFVVSMSKDYLEDFRIKGSDADLLAPALADVFRRNLGGDEGRSPSPDGLVYKGVRTSGLSGYGRLFWSGLRKLLVDGMATDLNTPDNTATIMLR